jgi:predicted ArsR family transcriptional regulator
MVKMSWKMGSSAIEDIHILTHPLRYRIAETLTKSKEPMFIGQIAEAVRADARLVSFHLATMLDYGFVEGEWKVSKLPRSKGKAVKYYRLTAKADQTLAHLLT